MEMSSMIKRYLMVVVLLTINISFATNFAVATDKLSLAAPKQDTKQSAKPDKGILLIARRGMPDPRFERSVILIASHDDSGSLGLIINRASQTRLGTLLPELKDLDDNGHSIYFGGPVGVNSLKFLVRHKPPPDAALHVMEDLYLSGNQSTLEAMLQNQKSSKELRIYLGYAGWAPGQLDNELHRKDWYLHKAAITHVFNSEPGLMWQELIELYDPDGQLVDTDGRGLPQMMAMRLHSARR